MFLCLNTRWGRLGSWSIFLLSASVSLVIDLPARGTRKVRLENYEHLTTLDVTGGVMGERWLCKVMECGLTCLINVIPWNVLVRRRKTKKERRMAQGWPAIRVMLAAVRRRIKQDPCINKIKFISPHFTASYICSYNYSRFFVLCHQQRAFRGKKYYAGTSNRPQ